MSDDVQVTIDLELLQCLYVFLDEVLERRLPKDLRNSGCYLRDELDQFLSWHQLH
jgi:hypothetical protein